MADEDIREDEALEEEALEEESEDSLLMALQEQWGAAPWYVSSVAIHSFVFLLLLLIPIEPPKQRKRKVIITTEIIQEEKPEEEPELALEENDPLIETKDDPQEIAPIIVTTDFELSDHNETADEMDMQTARGDPENISTIDDIQGTPALMGVGQSGGTGGAGRFGFRDGGGRRNLVARGGGSRRTESAVDWALRWLAEHQEADGHWDVKKYGGGLGHPPRDADASITALAVLAFLGAGNTPKFGKYKDNVAKGVQWLKRRQQASGLIGHHRYEGAITMMAMAEAYGMTQDPMLRGPAQRCVDYAVQTQGPAGGWRYFPDKPLDVDTSVTGWWIMGLKSAKVAGLSVPASVMNKALQYFQQATMTQGAGGATVSYSSEAETVNQVQRGGGSETMTAVSLVSLQFLGKGRNDPQVTACASQTVTDGVPNAADMNFYRWYYAALGLFQMGVHSGYWERWNPAMVKTLLSTQVREGTFKQNKGSWNYDRDFCGAAWGRVGQTAVGALMLEVYYRYHDVHKQRSKSLLK